MGLDGGVWVLWHVFFGFVPLFLYAQIVSSDEVMGHTIN